MSSHTRGNVAGYERDVSFGAPRERVFDAVATLRRVRGWWTPDWAGTTISFELAEAGAAGCVLTFEHSGLAAEQVAAGWDRFLSSLSVLVQTGAGDPYRAETAATAEALVVARADHAAWTSNDCDAARRYLDQDRLVRHIRHVHDTAALVGPA